MRSFVAAFADQYKGIVDTFVQLFPPRSAGLIAHIKAQKPVEASDIVETVVYPARTPQVTGPCFTPTAVLMAGADSAGNEER